MEHERKYWDRSCFVTFTYNNECLPKDEQLNKSHMQNWVKRMRKGGFKFKYFIAGEYGEQYHRPHYHAVLFGLGKINELEIERQWGLGFVQVKVLTIGKMLYVAKYICKAPLGLTRKAKYESREVPAFQICSHGIGLSWVMENAEEFGRAGIQRQGRKVPLPRYYIKKCREAGVHVGIVEEFAAERMQRTIEYYKKLKDRGIESEEEILKERRDYRLMKIEELLTKDGLKKTKDPF